MPFIEAPTTFYIGRRYDLASHRMGDEVVYYDSRDLTTHAVVVGMTGSGKTGLCISLLEEAVLDNIPAIVIDPKGDITNLLLAFPNLRPEDFAPWVNADDAQRSGLSLEQYARDVAQQWKDGLASWDIVPGRIGAMKRAAKFSIYTPGSDAGLPISILNSLQAPKDWAAQEEANRERISGLVTALLALVGIQAEPVKDREHVLISNIFEYAWRQGQNLTLEDIILYTQKPPFSKLGVFDVDTFFPEKDRFKLAMELNNIIAAPSFKSWIDGEPLDIQNLLYTHEGQPRVSIFYVAHLSEAERSFIITLILENMLAWMRTLSGTTSLRSILYFDEVFGHFPPAPRNPPTKEPLLSLLKQGRSFGIGCVLATQNPGDLDYKGLSNAGTWFIGKLQTEFDKRRVLGGLQSASSAQGNLDMDTLNKAISGLDPRVFVLHNVHDASGPILMHTRWTMSYLRGPLTRQQVRTLMDAQRQALGLPSTNVPGAPVQATPYVAPYVPSAAPTPAAAPTPVIPTPTTPAPTPAPKSEPPIDEAATPYVPAAPYIPGSTPLPQPAQQASKSPAAPPSNIPETTGSAPVVSGKTPAPPPPLSPEQERALAAKGAEKKAADKKDPMATRKLPVDQPPDLPPPSPLPTAIVPAEPAALVPAGDTAEPVDTDVPFYVNPAPVDDPFPNIGPSVPVPQQNVTVTKPPQETTKLPDGYHEKPFALPPSMAQFFLPTAIPSQQAVRDWEKRMGFEATSIGDARLVYRPVLLAQLLARYLDRKIGVEEDQRWAFHVSNLEKAGLVRWNEFQAQPVDPAQVSDKPFADNAYYGTLSPGLTDSKRLNTLKNEVIDYVYRNATLNLYHNDTLDLYSKPRENRRDYLLRAQQKAREGRDAEIDTVTQRFDGELSKLEERRRKEQRSVTYDKQALDAFKREELYTTGEAVLGLLHGRTSYTLSRMSRTRRWKQQAQERAQMSQQAVGDVEREIDAKQEEFQQALAQVNDKWAKIAATAEEVKLTPYKKDISFEIYGLGWVPAWYVSLNGQQVILPAFSTELKGTTALPAQSQSSSS